MSDRDFYTSTDGGVFSDPDRTSISRTISGKISTSPLGTLAIGELVIRVDNCLEQLFFDGAPVEGLALPYCNWARPLKVPRLPHMAPNQAGWSFSAVFTNYGGPGRFLISMNEALWLKIVRMVGYTIIITFILLLLLGRQSLTFVIPLLMGIVLRLLYFYHSDVYTRSHDLDGHLEYIRYVLSHWNIPNPSAGWEFHQGPIFYFLAAGYISLVKLLTGLTVSVAVGGKLVALVCSLLTLLFTLKTVSITAMTLNSASDLRVEGLTGQNLLISVGLIAVMMIVATHPNLIFCTMRVSNDSLIFMIVSYIIYRGGTQIATRTAASPAVPITSTIVAFLTKTNGIIGAVLWLCADLLTLPRRLALKRGLILALCLSTLGGGYAAYRCYQSQSIGLFYRAQNSLHPKLAVTNRVENFISFNPLRIVQDVYNDNWSEAKHRSLFFEYLIKSSVFGEFDHGAEALHIARLMLSLTLIMMTITALTLVSQGNKLDRIYVYSSIGIVCSVVMLLFFRLQHPFSCHQEARLIPAVFILAAVLIAGAINALSTRIVSLRKELWPLTISVLGCLLFSIPVVQVAFLLSVL